MTDFRRWTTIFIRFDRSILCQDLGFQTVADSTANQTAPRNPWTNKWLSFKHLALSRFKQPILVLWSRSVIGWHSRTRYLICQRLLASISLKFPLSYLFIQKPCAKFRSYLEILSSWYFEWRTFSKSNHIFVERCVYLDKNNWLCICFIIHANSKLNR